jgi:hypothetical protein
MQIRILGRSADVDRSLSWRRNDRLPIGGRARFLLKNNSRTSVGRALSSLVVGDGQRSYGDDDYGADNPYNYKIIIKNCAGTGTGSCKAGSRVGNCLLDPEPYRQFLVKFHS